MRHQPILYVTSLLIIVIAFFMGSLVFRQVEIIGSAYDQTSILATQPLNSETPTDSQTAKQLMQSAQAAPTIWLNTDTHRPEMAVETASEKLVPNYHLLEDDSAPADQICSSNDLFPALAKPNYFSKSNPVRSWKYVINLLTSPIDHKYYVPIISPLENVNEYTLIDGSTDHDDSTLRSVLSCNEQAMFVPASMMTTLSLISNSVNHSYLQ